MISRTERERKENAEASVGQKGRIIREKRGGDRHREETTLRRREISYGGNSAQRKIAPNQLRGGEVPRRKTRRSFEHYRTKLLQGNWERTLNIKNKDLNRVKGRQGSNLERTILQKQGKNWINFTENCLYQEGNKRRIKRDDPQI